MFSGKMNHTIDAKGRVFIPAKYREELGDSFIVARGFSDAYLVIYPQTEWEALIEEIDELGLDRDARLLKRYIMTGANPTEMDSQGRIFLSQEHREYAHFEKEVSFLGMGRTIEIWDTSSLEEQTASEPVNFEDFLSKIKAHGHHI